MLAKDLNIGYSLHVNQGGQLALQTQHFCCRLRQNLHIFEYLRIFGYGLECLHLEDLGLFEGRDGTAGVRRCGKERELISRTAAGNRA